MKRLIGWIVRRFYNSNFVMMTDAQLLRWNVYVTMNCDVRLGDSSNRKKIAQVGPIGGQTRNAILRRSGGLCEVKSSRCTRVASDIHHSIYRRHGGTNELENLKHICGACHQGIHAADNPKKKDKESIGDSMARKIRW